MQPRGLRLNNPGNIRLGTKWQGMADVQPDPAFVAFVSPEYGIRAMVKVLQTYFTKHKLDTISKMVARYAPPSENKTDKYIEHVALWSGIEADETLKLDKTTLLKLVKAFIRQEQGVQPYTDSTLIRGISLT